MIKYKSGDILKEDAEAIINTVNCVGVMGRGIALQFKNAYPENYKEYETACRNGIVQPGKMHVYETNQIIFPHYIINFPTKRHWREKSRIEDIQSGLESLKELIKEYNIKTIAIPPLGCGLGGLEWSEVKQRIESTLGSLSDVKIIAFEPNGAPKKNEIAYINNEPPMTPGRAALVILMNQYLTGLLDPFVTLLEVHKLMYFLQEAGEPLKLKYEKAQYGPYAENLRHVLTRIEGHFIYGYADGGDSPNKRLEPVLAVIDDAKKELYTKIETSQRTDRVIELVEGFESPFGLELLSTVHWVITHENARTLDEIISRTYSWNEGKKKFSKRQIDIAYKTLSDKQWIS